MSYTVVHPDPVAAPGHYVFVARDADELPPTYRAAQAYGMVLKQHEVCLDFYVIMKEYQVHVIPHNREKPIYYYERLINERQRHTI